MKLYLIAQDQNVNYDTYDSAVVAAPDEETARTMDPSNGAPITDWTERDSSWCNSPDQVSVYYLGEAVEGSLQGVVCASFNAG